MASKEFVLYVVAKDKHSENLIIYFYENMKEIKNNGFPKPLIYKLTKKELIKDKEILMENGLRSVPCIKFNGNIYSHNEVYDLLKTNLNKLRKKVKDDDEELERRYSNPEDYYNNIIMSSSSKKRMDSRSKFMDDDDDDEPITEEQLKKFSKMNTPKHLNKKEESEEIQGTTKSDISDISSEDEKPKKTKKSKHNKNTMNFDTIDSYYASLAMDDNGSYSS